MLKLLHLYIGRERKFGWEINDRTNNVMVIYEKARNGPKPFWQIEK